MFTDCTFSHLHPSIFDAMASWYSTRSRSRTTSRPRARGVGSSSRPSTRSSRSDYDTATTHLEPAAHRSQNDRPAHWRNPDRHVLILVNFQDLADLSARLHHLPDNADRLDAECRIHGGSSPISTTTIHLALILSSPHPWCHFALMITLPIQTLSRHSPSCFF